MHLPLILRRTKKSTISRSQITGDSSDVSLTDTSFSSRSFSSRFSRWCCPIGGSAVRRLICYWYCNSTSNSISNSYFCYRLFWFVIACYNTDNIVIVCYRLFIIVIGCYLLLWLCAPSAFHAFSASLCPYLPYLFPLLIAAVNLGRKNAEQHLQC